MMSNLRENAAPHGAAFLVVGAFESSPTLAACRAQERRPGNNPSGGGEARRSPNVGATWAKEGGRSPTSESDCGQSPSVASARLKIV